MTALVVVLALLGLLGWSVALGLLIGRGVAMADRQPRTIDITAGDVTLGRVHIRPGQAITADGVMHVREPISLRLDDELPPWEIGWRYR